MPRIELHFAGGEVRTIDAEPFETVYQAAVRAGVTLLTDCLEGACATCKAYCVEGEFELIDPSFDALSAEEEAAGQVLLCQMEARSACIVELPYSIELAEQSAVDLQATVVELRRISNDICFLALGLEDPRFHFVAGQYAQLGVPGTNVTRAYSFANAPHMATRPEFYVRLLPGGLMSEYLLERARPGDRMTLRGPLGGFYLRPGVGRLVLAGGGTGLAPLLSMLHALHAEGSRREIKVLHGARSRAGLFGRPALAELVAAGPDIDPAFAVEETPPEIGALTGKVTELFTPEMFRGEGVDVYLCGPPAMVSASESLLVDFGVVPQRIFTERFNPA